MTQQSLKQAMGSLTSQGAAFCIAGLSAAAVLISGALSSKPVSALPAFARQTGQPCATCHNGTYAQLTPFGRQFKLNGYTAGGTRCNDVPAVAVTPQNDVQVPLSMMVISGFTHTQKDQPAPPTNRDGFANGLKLNDNAIPVEGASIFLAGQLYCKLGSFAQVTYSRSNEAYFLDNTEFRYADKFRFGTNNVLWGLFANNNPTLDDVWNTSPAWRIPGGGWQASTFAVAPQAPLIESLGGKVGGLGGYVFVNNTFYGAFGAYKNLDRKTQNVLGQGDNPAVFDGLAPYWRLAIEKNWGDFSLMAGTFGMYASIIPDRTQTTFGDKFTDVGWDTQFQYLHGAHFLTLRASYVDEWTHLDGTFNLASGQATNNLKNHLSQLNLSATYAYNSIYSVTAGYFDVRGITDMDPNGVIPSYWTSGGTPNPSGSPNARGEVLDFGFAPWSNGGPALYPWFNTRVGVQFTHYDKTQGASTNYDGAGRNAKDDDAVWLYSWMAY